MLATLRAMAGPTVSVLGAQPFATLRDHYSRCRGLIFPGEEDFGIVPVEAMASGRPVVAFGRGGATETVVEGITGTFFHEQSADALIEALDRLESLDLDPLAAVARAQDFDTRLFETRFQHFVAERLQQHGRSLGGYPTAEPIRVRARLTA